MKFKLFFFTSEFLTRALGSGAVAVEIPVGKLRPVGKLSMLSESLW
jgi:hypothetical protein